MQYLKKKKKNKQTTHKQQQAKFIKYFHETDLQLGVSLLGFILLQNKFETKKAKYIHTYSKKQYFSIWGAKKKTLEMFLLKGQ